MLPAEIEGKYKDTEIISENGKTIIVKGRHKTVDVLHCIKIYYDIDVDSEEAKRLKQEAKALGEFERGYVVNVHDADVFTEEERTGFYIAMDWIDGKTMEECLEEGITTPFNPAEIVDWGVRLAKVFKYAHSKDIIHKDIKPQNIMFEKVSDYNDIWHVKLIDFGASTHIRDNELEIDEEGTVGYFAPEIIDPEQEVGFKADVYSLGVVFWEALTKERFIEHHSYLEGFSEVEYIKAREFKKEIPLTFDQLLEEMVSQKSQNRPTMLEVIKRLEKIEEEFKVWSGPQLLETEEETKEIEIEDPQLLEALLELDQYEEKLYLDLVKIKEKELEETSYGEIMNLLEKGLNNIPDSYNIVNKIIEIAISKIENPDKAIAAALKYIWYLNPEFLEEKTVRLIEKQLNSSKNLIVDSRINGKDEEILELLLNFNSKEKLHKLSLDYLGLALNQKGFKRSAIYALTESLKDVFPGEEKVFFTLLDILLQDNQYKEVIRLCEDKSLSYSQRNYLELKKKYGLALVNYLYKYKWSSAQGSQDLKNAKEILDELLEGGCLEKEVILGTSKAYEMEKDFNKAIDILLEAKANEEINYHLEYNIARLYRAIGEWKEVENYCREYLDYDSNYLANKALLGLALARLENFQEAKSMLEKAYKLDPKLFQQYLFYLIALGDSYKETGYLEKAKNIFEEYIYIKLRIEKWEQIGSVEEKYLDNDLYYCMKEVIDCLLKLGEYYSLISTRVLTILEYDPPIKIKSKLKLARCESLYQLQKYEEAFSLVSEILEEDYKENYSYKLEGLILLALGKDATKSFMTYIKNETYISNNIAGLNLLLKSYYYVGNYEKAVETYNLIMKWNKEELIESELDKSSLLLVGKSLNKLETEKFNRERRRIAKKLSNNKGKKDLSYSLAIKLNLKSQSWKKAKDIIEKSKQNDVKLYLNSREINLIEEQLEILNFKPDKFNTLDVEIEEKEDIDKEEIIRQQWEVLNLDPGEFDKIDSAYQRIYWNWEPRFHPYCSQLAKKNIKQASKAKKLLLEIKEKENQDKGFLAGVKGIFN
ncbi:MAG: protein kinase domain-containing protein [Bacillota bacterium]